MSFWIARADSNGNMISSSQMQLSPGPTRVEYPTDPAGTMLETADGIVIQQTPNKDPRRRAWVWAGYPLSLPQYNALWDTLTTLRSYNRKLFGASPWVYVKDDTTKRLRRLDIHNGTATGTQSASTLQDSGQSWGVNAFAGYDIEIVGGTGAGQVKTVASNTATTLTISGTWSTTPVAGSSIYSLHGYIDDWFKVRVVEVSRQTQDTGGDPRYPSTRFVFVIEDANSPYMWY